MAGIVVVGAQWGDEGKGKIVDLFASEADCVVRFQGGANAGHTLVVKGQKTVLHLIPSGILHKSTKCVIASGVVIDVEQLVDEIKMLKDQGHLTNDQQLLVSENATVILPYHKALDHARENEAGAGKLGTTGRGIGPAYEDRASRRAILFGDLFSPETLMEKITQGLKEKNVLLKNLYKGETFKAEDLTEKLLTVAKLLEPYRCADTSLVTYKILKGGKKVLFEGAQGTLLDLLHGTYPYVTSSSTVAGAASSGCGVSPHFLQKIVGITKAYTTRVGTGPFPTELFDEDGERLQVAGAEFGSTTGRKRRCGWVDLVALRYAIRTNGITNLALMKLDVLSGFSKIKACVGYELDDKEITDMPLSGAAMERAKPVYKEMPGWEEDLSGVRSINELPRNAREYVHFLGSELSTPIDVISVGPSREQTVWIKPLFG